ncbi:MAG TPA: hypothetical protein PLB96_06760 [Syntrophales bacterium]|mgnify:CR=1 FL=1|nr:hypothetical protein [Syntrophales bacterium]
MSKRLRVMAAVFVAAALISGCMEDAMDKSKMPQKAAEAPAAAGK